MKKKIDTRTVVTISVMVVLIIAAIVGLSISSSSAQHEKDSQAAAQETSMNTAYSDVVKSSLDVYYVNNYQRYPTSIDSLKEYLKTYEKKSYDSLVESVDGLKNFSYKTSGDMQTYKFTYIGASNKTETVQKNYQKDV